ncbi:MAG: hypothetical protein H6702_16005 [Myxococcales bacterium]|nr:hypothetical protein [Myxococcales bacterium]
MQRMWLGVAVFGLFSIFEAHAEPLCGGEHVGAPCLTGLAGQCAYGRLVCPAQGEATCAPTPTEERCNGVDDDCNGIIDDGCAARPSRPTVRPRPRRPAAPAGLPG